MPEGSPGTGFDIRRHDVKNQSKSGFWRLVPSAEGYLRNQSAALRRWHEALGPTNRSIWLTLYPGGFEQAALDNLPHWIHAAPARAR